MATIERTGSKWRVRQFLDGKLRTVASASTKADAQNLQARIEEEERSRVHIVRGSQLHMGEILARWKAAKVGTGNDPLHTAAAEAKLRNLTTARNWETTSSITAASVSAYRQSGGSSRACGFLAATLRWARDTLDQYVDPKALLALRGGRKARRPSPVLMEEDEVCIAIQAAYAQSASAGALTHCLASYGWRPITAARMVVGDYDPFTGTVTGRVKGGDHVRHLVAEETAALLRPLVLGRKPTDPLFLDPRTGLAWDLAAGISEWARNHLKLKVYDLKRYAISTMLSRGVPPQDVAGFTGHRTVAQVLGYGRSNEERQRSTLRAVFGKSWKVMESHPNKTGQDAL